MIGFILAAGFGTRLKPLTDHIPKALVPVCGKPLLARSIDFFHRSGVDRIAVNAHHHPEKIKAFLDSQDRSCEFFHETGRIRGTGGALHFAREFLATSDIFCVANVDIVAAIDLAALLGKFVRLDCCAGLIAMPSQNGTIWYHRRSMDYLGARSEPLPPPRCAPEDLAGGEFPGIAFYRREALAVLDKNDFSILPVWKRMQEAGMRVCIVESGSAYWNDTGTPRSLAAIHFDVIGGACRLDIPDNVIIDGAGKKAYPRSFDSVTAARLGPYSWVEADAVPSSSSLSRTVVFRGATVPENADLRNTILTPYGAIPFET